MKVNKLMNALLVFLILIVCVGAVSAEETVQAIDASSDAAIDDDIAVSEVASNAAIDDDIAVGEVASNTVDDSAINSESSLSDDIVADDSTGKLGEGDTLSYKDIQDAMVSGNEVNLTKDVKYDPEKDSYKYISVGKRMTINGNGHIIDGNNMAKMFLISGGVNNFQFTLNNVTLTNGLYDRSNGYSGGAIGIIGDTKRYVVNLNNVRFINNHAACEDVSIEKGGAIYMSASRSDLNINNCTFENNSATGYGGAIAIEKGKVTITNSNFTNNTLDYGYGHGGAIYGQTVSINNSNFINNKAGNINGYGGAISCDNMNIHNSTFINNSANTGGALGNNDRGTTNCTITNSTFENNTANLNGGAIHIQHSSMEPKMNILNIENCSFKDNDGGRYGGGAICSPNATVKNSNFTNNKVFLYGGAISATTVDIDNCKFDDNSAKRAGAIFALNLTIKQCEFNGNEAEDDSIIVTHKDYVCDDETVLPKIVTYAYIYDPWDYSYEATQDYNYFLHCIEHELYDFYVDSFCTTDTGYLINYVDRSEVYEQLKILYYLCHIDENFLDGGFRNYWGQYNLSATIADLCMEDLSNPEDDAIKRVMELYNSGFRVPDGMFMLPNGTFVKYRFYFFINPEDVQNFLWYTYSTIDEKVSKETLNKSVQVGEEVQFRIKVTNNGNTTLKGVFVNDSDFDEGLIYQSYINETGDWILNETSKIWTLTTDLEAGQSASFIIVFKTTKVGELVNNVTAGFENYVLSNSTNTTNVTNTTDSTNETNDTNDTNETNETDVPEEDIPDEDVEEDVPDEDVEEDVPDEDLDEDVPDEEVDKDVPDKVAPKKVSKAHVSKTATGNPLLALILVLMALGLSPIRRKK